MVEGRWWNVDGGRLLFIEGGLVLLMYIDCKH